MKANSLMKVDETGVSSLAIHPTQTEDDKNFN
jgi:hypothetical protein